MRAPAPIFLLAVVAACHAPASAPVFAWPTPPGWKHETIPFPLEFAPDIPYRGTEEVRFEPRFFDPAADTYFTYSFAWVLDGAALPSDGELAAHIRRYFSGLMTAVGKEKHVACDPGVFDAHVNSVEAGHYTGEVRAVDAFGDGRALLLHLDAEARRCAGRTVVLVSLSPHAVADPTFQALLAQRATFACTK